MNMSFMEIYTRKQNPLKWVIWIHPSLFTARSFHAQIIRSSAIQNNISTWYGIQYLLPIKYCIIFKQCLLIFKTISFGIPTYFKDIIVPYTCLTNTRPWKNGATSSCLQAKQTQIHQSLWFCFPCVWSKYLEFASNWHKVFKQNFFLSGQVSRLIYTTSLSRHSFSQCSFWLVLTWFWLILCL